MLIFEAKNGGQGGVHIMEMKKRGFVNLGEEKKVKGESLQGSRRAFWRDWKKERRLFERKKGRTEKKNQRRERKIREEEGETNLISIILKGKNNLLH